MCFYHSSELEVRYIWVRENKADIHYLALIII